MKKSDFPQVKLSYRNKNQQDRYLVNSPKTAYEALKPSFNECMYHHEEAHLLLLNQANKVLGTYFISKGSGRQTIIDIKSIFQTILLSNASAIVLAHNHPSGQLKPSREDILVTQKLKEGCKFFDIQLLDHIIMCGDHFYSFEESGTL